ncbi:hypothetical protein CDD80_6124 [Ophiocordyceps camponoti-rufipedis]|uniref:CID domain-containing protein n=1 Tax=Ophiocordyceps camponoti-rufipedis TaxID=2004952 RepID=A0A2C5YRB0_9HYPO|nr:hypothetical protein CDD80_6124 [Ophiocordyceps camponoti-rufipedis]
MASAVADLEAGLQAMLNLKPPGVSGSRITSLTSLCVSNIQSESVLIQKIYTHFKKAPGTHKLGVLYVVDSVTRKWLEQAKSQGQPVNSAAQDGTYAAGVHRVTELMPVLMNDIFQSAPDEQKEKIKKLLDIWGKGQTFPVPMLESFREKLSAPPPPNASTTPPGSPPPNTLVSQQDKTKATTAPPNGSSILEALANIARQNTTASSSKPAPPSFALPASGLATSAPPPPPMPPMTAPPSFPPSSQTVTAPSLQFPLPQMPSQPPMPASTNPAANPYGPVLGLDSNTQQQIMLIKALADQGIPLDKIPAFIQSMTGGANPQSSFQPPVPTAQGSFSTVQQTWAADNARGGYQDGNRSPNRFHGRSRSRSPDRGWGARGSPRDRPEFGHGEDRDRNGRRGNGYRQRSPQGRRGRSASPTSELPKIDRWLDYDASLPAGHIRVLSRTLFVGGVTCTEADLRNIFSRFGTVQTCIVNKEKRHAFVKMLTRKDAVTAKDSTEDSRNLELPLRTRWGVGYGPRDCSDYATGISVIPIHKLTEADRKWMLTAPYGGSGGRPIETGLCVEEPDIEIGAGVSSKAISRRMQTDKGGSNGPKSTRNRDDEGRGRRGRDGNQQQRRGDDGDGQQTAMSGFPFGMGSLPNGIPNFPTGFAFPNPGAGAGN